MDLNDFSTRLVNGRSSAQGELGKTEVKNRSFLK